MKVSCSAQRRSPVGLAQITSCRYRVPNISPCHNSSSSNVSAKAKNIVRHGRKCVCSCVYDEGFVTSDRVRMDCGPVIKVIGVGGGGSNVVNRMLEDDIVGIEAWVVNTDAQALANSRVAPEFRIQIGAKSTRGLGAGGDPEVGLRAAKESKDELENALRGADLVVVTAGLGGGTGSGAAPMVCELAQSMDILTVAFATLPFTFEGRHRRTQALEAGKRMAKSVDSMVVVPNDKLLGSSIERTVVDAFKYADSALVQGVRGISDIIMVPGLINVDFADVRSIMHQAGNSHMASGTGVGEGRAEAAALAAIESPLLESSINSATGVVWNITGPMDLTIAEVDAAAALICGCVDENANIIFGAVLDPDMHEEVHVTLILTGFRVATSEIPMGTGYALQEPSSGKAKVPSFLSRRSMRGS